MLDQHAMATGGEPPVVHEPRPTGGGVVVEVVETPEGFRRLRGAWHELRARDPDYSVFLGWDWLAKALEDNAGRWRILVARAGAAQGTPVAILPLALRARWNAEAEELQTGLEAGGQLILSPFSGLLCDPDHEAAALPALARALAARPWSEFELRNVVAESRLARFADCFDPEFFEAGMVQPPADMPERRRIVLPDSFESWLQTGPDAATARAIRALGRRQLRSGWRVEFTDAATFARDAEVLVGARMEDWRATRGPAVADQLARNTHAVLANALRAECLMMCVLWDGEAPLGALAHVLDHEMDRVHAVHGAQTAPQDNPGVGLALHAESIRWAIGNGFDRYDFMPAPPGQRAGFGGRPLREAGLRVVRRDAAGTAMFDRMSLGDGLRQLTGLLDDGRAAAARRAAEQLSKLVR